MRLDFGILFILLDGRHILFLRTNAIPPTVNATAITSPSSSLLTGGGLVNELQQLSDLHKSGALSDSEYEAAKSKLLSGTPSVVSDGNNSTQHIPPSSLL